MKLAISKNREGSGYYTTLKNNYQGKESKMYMSVQLAKGLELEFGTYDVNCFLSCYTTKNGEVKPKIVVTGLKENNKQTVSQNSTQNSTQSDTQTDIYSEFGEEVVISDDWLD